MEKICKAHAANLETIITAAKADRLCLLECMDNLTGETVAVICAVSMEENGDYSFVPFAALINGDPYQRFTPPMSQKEG